MFTAPFSYLTSAAGNEPLGGYSVWIDFADSGVLTLTGTDIDQINTKTDTGASTVGFTPRAGGYTVVYDPVKKALDGGASTTGYFLEEGTLGNELFYPGGAFNFGTVEQTLVTITSEASFRGQPFGWEANLKQCQQIFFNDSTGDRTGQFDAPEPQITGITNDNTKDCLMFNTVYNATVSAADQFQTFYRGATEQSNALTNWTLGGLASGADTSKIGGTSRNSATFYGFTGYIYSVLQYPFALDATQRADLATWATDYYGLTLQ